MELYLIRHTKVEIDNGLCYGQSDIDLAETFEEEVEELKKKLPPSAQIVFYSSPSKRCFLISKKLATNPTYIDKRLLELDFGDWELKKWDSIDKLEFKEWEKDIINHPIPHGESYLDLFNRSNEFFEEIIKKDHKKVAIITHSGVIRSILSYILKIPLKNSFIIQISYGKVSKININHSKGVDSIINIEYINK